MEREIITEHVYPPIPIRSFDWAAYRDGWDLGEHIGQGVSKDDAIKDLLEKEEEYNTKP